MGILYIFRVVAWEGGFFMYIVNFKRLLEYILRLLVFSHLGSFMYKDQDCISLRILWAHNTWFLLKTSFSHKLERDCNIMIVIWLVCDNDKFSIVNDLLWLKKNNMVDIWLAMEVLLLVEIIENGKIIETLWV